METNCLLAGRWEVIFCFDVKKLASEKVTLVSSVIHPENPGIH